MRISMQKSIGSKMHMVLTGDGKLRVVVLFLFIGDPLREKKVCCHRGEHQDRLGRQARSGYEKTHSA
jgi:hypothetical protein